MEPCQTERHLRIPSDDQIHDSQHHPQVGGGGGGGGTLIYSYIRRLRSFWVQNFELQYFLGFSEK